MMLHGGEGGDYALGQRVGEGWWVFGAALGNGRQVFGGRCLVAGRSSAARAAHREQRSLLRLFRAS